MKPTTHSHGSFGRCWYVSGHVLLLTSDQRADLTNGAVIPFMYDASAFEIGGTAPRSTSAVMPILDATRWDELDQAKNVVVPDDLLRTLPPKVWTESLSRMQWPIFSKRMFEVRALLLQ